MTVVIPACKLTDLIFHGLIPDGVIEDVLGNRALMNDDGTVTLDADNVRLSFTKSARVHNVIMGNIERRVNPWIYWYAVFDDRRVRLDYLKMVVEYNLDLDKAFRNINF